MDYSAIRVASGADSWLAEDFIPRAVNAFCKHESGLFAIVADSVPECDVLMRVIEDLLRREFSVVCRRFAIDRYDPTLSWESVFGLPDRAPALRLRETDAIAAYGGAFLPGWFIDAHLRHFQDLIHGAETRLIVPVDRSLADLLSDDTVVFAAPSLATAGSRDRLKLIEELTSELIADLRDEPGICRRFAREEFWNAIEVSRFETRSEIEECLGYCAAEFDPEHYSGFAEYAREKSLSTWWPVGRRRLPIASRESLRLHFNKEVARLETASEKMNDEFGCVLFETMHDLPCPFQQSDPLGWFTGCVSWLSCMFFDAGKKTAFNVVSGFLIDAESGAIIANDGKTFVEVLRTLRTFLQHGLNPNVAKHVKERTKAMDWLVESAVGEEESFGRAWGRGATSRLLKDLTCFVDTVSDVVEALPDATIEVKRQVKQGVYNAERRLAQHELRELLQQVIREEGIDVDLELVEAKCAANIMHDVANSCCRIENLEKEARRICQDHCYQMARKPPSAGEVLQSHGLVGREVAEGIKRLKDAWDGNLLMSQGEYFELAAEVASSIVAARERMQS